MPAPGVRAGSGGARGELGGVTLFDVFSKREADGTGLPNQASDDELLAWGIDLRTAPEDGEVSLEPGRPRRRPLRAEPDVRPPRRVLVASPDAAPPVVELPTASLPVRTRREPLRARPLGAAPAAHHLRTR